MCWLLWWCTRWNLEPTPGLLIQKCYISPYMQSIFSPCFFFFFFFTWCLCSLTLKKGGPGWKPTLWMKGCFPLHEWNIKTTESKTNLQQTALTWVKVKNQMSILRAGGAPILVRCACQRALVQISASTEQLEKRKLLSSPADTTQQEEVHVLRPPPDFAIHRTHYGTVECGRWEGSVRALVGRSEALTSRFLN